jgi:hypothetical protein
MHLTAEHAKIIYCFFSAFSAISAVNFCVSFSIKLAVDPANGGRSGPGK